MKRLIYIVLILSLCGFLTSCKGQTNESRSGLLSDNNIKSQPGVAGRYDKEFAYYGISKISSSSDTSAGWSQNGQKILLTGIVYQSDGKTPAPGVLIYYYHTNTAGKYLHKPEEKRSMPPNELGQTHGYIRGWVKTDSSGKYYIYTVKPGVYPTHDEPAHIHATIKEPNGIKEYYIDDFVFDDDKLLTSAKRKKMDNRCGSGVLRMVEMGELQIGERNLFLGLNIPGYPVKNNVTLNSGRNIGEDVFSFMPNHAWGPDKGTKTCPVCKYGWYDGILYFVGNHPNWPEIRQWLVFVEKESKKREKYLKVYFIYGNDVDYSKAEREGELEKLGRELTLNNVALTFVPSFSVTDSEIYLNNINQTVENTFIIYKRSRIIDKYVNLKPGQENFKLIAQRLDQSVNEYFDLKKPGAEDEKVR